MPTTDLTRSVTKGEEVHHENLKRFLQWQQLIDDEKSELRVRQFYNGYSNLTYLLLIEGKEFVLRRPPFAATKRGHNMAREFKVLNNLYKLFDYAPRAYVHSDDPSIIGAPFYVMSRVEGIILTAGEAKRLQVSAKDFSVIANTWLDAFVALHEVDYSAVGLADLGRPIGYVERQVKNWSKQYLAVATEHVRIAQKIMEWLTDHQPNHYSHSLIHNDYKYDNIVFSNKGWTKLTAVLDWEMCTIGDPLMDLGTSLGYWTTSEDAEFLQYNLPSPTTMEGNPTREEIVQQYVLKSGRNVDHLTFYYTFGLFKIAVIAQQIFYRFMHGHTSDQRFANLNKTSAICCKMAWQAIQKNRIDQLY